MDRRKLLRIIVWLCRIGLAALFLFAAGAKLVTAKEFAGKVAELLGSLHLNYKRWMWPGTIAVISIEVITALLLLIPRTVRLGALVAALLLIGFSAFALYYVYVLHGLPLECECFGKLIASQLGVRTALRNLVLLVPAILVLVCYRRPPRPLGIGFEC